MNETWKAIPGYEGFYEASDFGRIKSQRRAHTSGGIMRPYSDKAGYQCVLLHAHRVGRRFRIHRLVLEAFRGKRQPGQVCRHLDGNPSNNCLTNIKWGSNFENTEDKRQHGRSLLGERHPQSKLTVEQVLEIRDRPMSERNMAKHYGVSRVTIQKILSRRTWGHIEQRAAEVVKDARGRK